MEFNTVMTVLFIVAALGVGGLAYWLIARDKHQSPPAE